jgi:hypothetical protein
MLQTGGGSAALVGQHVVRAAGDAAPTACAGTNVKGNICLRQRGGFGIEGMIGFVTPVQRDRAGGNFGNRFGMLKDSIGPEQDLPVVSGGDLLNFLQELEIDCRDAERFALGAAAALADVEGLR